MRLARCSRQSPDGGPASVRVAAGRAARDLRLPVDIDAVGVVAAFRAAGLIGCTGNDGAVAFWPLAAPAHRNARFAVLERLHLGRIGMLPVAFVEAGADRTAQNAPGDTGGTN